MSNQTILLETPKEDLMPMVELLHHLSQRETLFMLNLDGQTKSFDTAIQLFGINPIFGIKTNYTMPIFEKLSNIGTLFINNIHYLDHETQKHLAEFIQYGLYRIFKSDQKLPSNVRIICTENQNPHALVQEKQFNQNLYDQLKKHKLSLPSLITMPEKELYELADGFAQQAIKSNTFKNLLALTTKDKMSLISKRPESLQELKTKVQQLLKLKSI